MAPGLYFWEIFFHAPFLVADSLSNNQRYAEAKDWYEYIFNPTQQPEGDSGADAKRYWRFLPLRDMTIQSLTQILTDPAQIAAYNNDPFDPDAIARLRTTAYAKAVVMKYIRNLLAWGDFYAQDTRESINQATNLYVLANQLLGPRRWKSGLLGAGADELQRHQAGVQQPQHHHRRRRRRHGQYPDAGRHRLVGARRLCRLLRVHHLRQGANQSRYITGYDAANKRLTVEIGWNPVPDTSSHRVYANGIPEFLIRLENTPMALPPPCRAPNPATSATATCRSTTSAAISASPRTTN